MSQAESESSTKPSTASDNVDFTLVRGVVANLNVNLQRLNDALRAFMSVTGDDLRPAMERLVEDLIAALDAVDGNRDIEEDAGDCGEPEECFEPSLGSLDNAKNQERWAYGNSMDSEHEHDGREPDSDDEPLEGWPEREGQGPFVRDGVMEAFR
jgi:hypothetical protein